MLNFIKHKAFKKNKENGSYNLKSNSIPNLYQYNFDQNDSINKPLPGLPNSNHTYQPSNNNHNSPPTIQAYSSKANTYQEHFNNNSNKYNLNEYNPVTNSDNEHNFSQELYESKRLMLNQVDPDYDSNNPFNNSVNNNHK